MPDSRPSISLTKQRALWGRPFAAANKRASSLVVCHWNGRLSQGVYEDHQPLTLHRYIPCSSFSSYPPTHSSISPYALYLHTSAGMFALRHGETDRHANERRILTECDYHAQQSVLGANGEQSSARRRRSRSNYQSPHDDGEWPSRGGSGRSCDPQGRQSIH